MLFLTALIIASAFSFLCAGVLKKHPVPFYIGGAVLSAAVTILAQQHIESPFVRNYLLGIFSRGAFAGALWVIVMGMRVLPNGSKPIKRLMPIRGELSIFAAAVTMSHIIIYAVSYIKRLMNPDLSPTADVILTCAVCAGLVVIMLPLTIISFKKIRSKMDGKKWKKIQKFAYVFYALIYIHVMVIFIPRARLGQSAAFVNCIVYTAVWSAYLALRVRKWYIQSKKPLKNTIANVLAGAGVLVFTGSAAITGHAAPQNKLPAAETASPTAVTAPVVFTAAPKVTAAEESVSDDTSSDDTSVLDAVTEIGDDTSSVSSRRDNTSSLLTEDAVTELSSPQDNSSSSSSSTDGNRTDATTEISSSSNTEQQTVTTTSPTQTSTAVSTQQNTTTTSESTSVTTTTAPAETTAAVTTTPQTAVQNTVPANVPDNSTDSSSSSENNSSLASPEPANNNSTPESVPDSSSETDPSSQSPAPDSSSETESKTETTAAPAPESKPEPETTTTEETTTTITEPEPVYIYNNGSYEDKAYGYHGYITVKITIEDDVITSFEAAPENEDELEYFNMAYPVMGQEIMEKQTADVDGVSGATYSSDAIKKALKKCLDAAKK